MRSSIRANQWHTLIDARFLPFLIEGNMQKAKRYIYIMLISLLCFAVLILSGPTWKQHSSPVSQSSSALVVVWDLSPSMNVEDVKPSRLIRARLKLIDLLKQRTEGLTGLVVYSGEAHVVTPLTDDIKTIISLLPGLTPEIMPIQGSNTEMALETARQLLIDSKVGQGDILFLSDGVSQNAAEAIDNLEPMENYDVSFWGIGTNIGGPIPLSAGGFAKNNRGELVVAKLDESIMADIASNLGGLYVPFTNTSNDIDTLNNFKFKAPSESTRETERTFDQWVEFGPYFVLLLLPFAMFAFRRGWVLSVFPFIFLSAGTFSNKVEANTLDSIFLTTDQRAEKAFKQGNHEEAAQLFDNRQWQGVSQFKNGDMESALNSFSQGNSYEDAYNLGNTLAHTGNYEAAIEAYNDALNLNPESKIAQENKAVAEQLFELAQQQKQEGQDGEEGEKDDREQSQNKDDGQSSDNNDSSDSKSSESENGDSQGSNQENSQEGSEENGEENSASNSESNLDEAANDALDKKYKSDQQKSEEELAEQENPLSPEESTEENDTESSEENNNDERQQQANSAPAENEDQQQEAANQLAQQVQDLNQSDEQMSEEQQALNQWLRKVPDDPSGLMRNKFKHQYQQRLKEFRAGRWEPPNSGDDTRW